MKRSAHVATATVESEKSDRRQHRKSIACLCRVYPCVSSAQQSHNSVFNICKAEKMLQNVEPGRWLLRAAPLRRRAQNFPNIMKN